MRGVVVGMTMQARMPRRCAANATPCAWLPAEAAMTPRALSASLKPEILLYAPRNLNEKTGCRSSRLISTRFPMRAESRVASSKGVSSATS
jgi:hypothetical protein